MSWKVEGCYLEEGEVDHQEVKCLALGAQKMVDTGTYPGRALMPSCALRCAPKELITGAETCSLDINTNN